MAIVLGLAAAVVYGAADFAGGLATRRTPALTVVVLSQLMGLVVLVVALPFVASGPPLAGDLVRGGLAGIGGGTGVALLYRGLAVGRMSVVAPITAVGAAALPVAWGLVSGERPGVGALVGVLVALVAVVLVSAASPAAAGDVAVVAPSPEASATGAGDVAAAGPGVGVAVRAGTALGPGILEAGLAGLAFGVFFILLDGTSADAGLWPLLGARTSILVAGAAAAVSRTSLRPAPGQLPRIALAGLLDMGGNVLYVLAAQQGLLSLVAVLVSLYPASTVLLARVVLGERLAGLQRVGLALAAAGIALIAAG